MNSDPRARSDGRVLTIFTVTLHKSRVPGEGLAELGFWVLLPADLRETRMNFFS